MSELLRWIVAMNLWTAGLLAVAVLADVVLARRVRPAWRVALYLPVLVRVAMPVDWTSPVSPFELLASDPVPAPTLVAAKVATETLPLVGSPSPAIDPPSIKAARISTDTVLLSAWMIGALALLGALANSHLRLVRSLRTSAPARDRLQRLAGAVEVREHAHLGPLTYGLVHSIVVFPRRIVDTLDDRELRCVLAHELAHVRRHDAALALALAVTSSLAWPILAVRMAAVRVRRLVELAADELALRDGSDVETYGRTLVRIAADEPAIAGAMQLGGYRHLRSRVAALRHRRRPAAAVQLGIVGLATFTPLACAGLDEPTEETRAAHCEALKHQATAAHDAAERSRDPAGLVVALEHYDELAARCADEPDYDESMYYRAEARWAVAHAIAERGDDATSAFEAAHAAFMEVLAGDPSRFAQDAAFAQMLAKLNALEIDRPSLALPARATKEAPAQGEKREDWTPTDYTADELALLASYDTFERHVTDLASEELQRVLHHRAQLAMDHARFDEALPVLERLLSIDVATPWHVHAAGMLLDLHTIAAFGDPTASPSDKADARRELAAWCDRVPTMALWSLPDAEPLRAAVPALQNAVTHAR